ncbi:hypothetical protein O181_057876, partial [Austropuccinia psidii MF-1]|nr:hypothetical protein [Austropuccinia psidii MF-1]
LTNNFPLKVLPIIYPTAKGVPTPFSICPVSKLRSNPLQARVPPDGQRTYSATPDNMMSHLLQAQVKPQNLNYHHMRTIQLLSLNLSPPSPLLQPSPAFPAIPRSIIIIDNTPVRSPHSHSEALQEFTDL